MKNKIIKNLVYSKSNIPKLAKYDRIKQGLEKINMNKIKSILDLGCGPGQALYTIKKLGFNGSYLGVDNDPDMINMANKFYSENQYKNFFFKKKEIQKYSSNKKFDLILIWGVISFFDNYKIFINKMNNLLNSDGTISIFSGFTENDYSVYVKYKYKNEKKQSGLNMHSISEIENYLKEKGFKINKKKFLPKINLKRKKNPLNSFFLFNDKNEKILANGLNIIRQFYFINARKR